MGPGAGDTSVGLIDSTPLCFKVPTVVGGEDEDWIEEGKGERGEERLKTIEEIM